jgi:thiol:disulfide interchange protein DsbD
MRTLLVFLALIFTGGLQAQLSPQFKPVQRAHWKLSSKKIGDCEYDLIFTVSLEKGWHTFSVNKVKGAEDEVSATEIIFKPGKDYVTVGKLTESKPTTEYDKTIKKNIFVHYNTAVFTQRIKLTSATKVKITGTYEYQVCKDVCEKPPYEDFVFDLQGSGACKR